MIFLLSLFWFIREIRAILFWLYLWQLKEYHIGRFIDHFRTEKGKKLLFNELLFFKIISILLFFLLFRFRYVIIQPWLNYQVLTIFVLILYFLESAKEIFDFFGGKLKTPVFTKKILFLFFVIFSFQIFYLFSTFNFNILRFLIYLLIFDILTPAIVSGIVLVFQPITALFRYQIIQKAKKKRLQPPLHPPTFGGPLAQFKDLLVIGITGSYGKTSTKEFLYTILAEKFGKDKILKTKEHQNSEVGISRCILNDLKPEHQIFIVEMGAYNKGGIKLLCDIAKPKIGIVTGVNEQHLATFGSMENLLSAEGGVELIDSLPEDGIAFFNGKNTYCRELFEKTELKKKFLYGENSPLLMENLEGAKLVAREIGLKDEEIEIGCQKIKNKIPGIQIKKGGNGLNIIDATYSANPDGVLSHLEYLKTFPGKKVIVMPCLIELGKASKEVHKKIGEKIGQVCNLAIITTKDKFKEIKEGAIKSGMPAENILFLENPKEIFEKIKDFNGPEDIILLESRVPKELIALLTSPVRNKNF